MGHDLAHHGTEDLGVALQQREPRLARFLRHAAGENDNPRPVEIGVITRAHHRGRAEGDGMGDILGFGPRTSPVQVDEHDLGRDPLERQGEPRRRSDHARADNSDLHCDTLRSGLSHPTTGRGAGPAP